MANSEDLDPTVELHKNIFSALSLYVGPLHSACAREDAAGVAAAIADAVAAADATNTAASGAATAPSVIESRNRHGATPLHAACACGDLEVVRLLVEAHGADVGAVKSKSASTS